MLKRAIWIGIVLLLVAARFCHLHVLWVEEAYPTAAAAELLRGKVLYRDIWFDKPPFFAGIYILWGAQIGWGLRVAGSLFAIFTCWVASRSARVLWGEKTELWAAGLMAVFLTFDTASAVMALTPDLLTVPLHMGAIALAAAGFPLWAGAVAGISILFNAKGLLILLVCLAWSWPKRLELLAGFAGPVLISLAWMGLRGSLLDYWQEVWAWGAVYSRDTNIPHPMLEGARRTLNWAGFHIALVVATCITAWKEEDWRWAVWLVVSVGGVFLGLRFFPRYYFHLLPVFVLLAARGFTLLPRRFAILAAFLLFLPVVRFGPRYVALAQDKPWGDLLLFRSSQEAANTLKAKAAPGDTLLVYGYRPDLFPLSGLPAGTRFLDSQPLNGVIADRHLISAKVSFPQVASTNRDMLMRSPRPTWIADGLGPYNGALDVRVVLKDLMKDYRLEAQTTGYRLWRLQRTGE
ncbi:MAG: hypothetical protein J0H49_02080 [Acidobacteria bacterium]|nr:hypothetical protein [Acidobacteriota bacterium]